MAAPNIEMIAASLRSCSLKEEDGGGGDHSPPRPLLQHLAEVSDKSAGGITLELNSETALPFHWEQRLDIRTGEIYFINWETGVRTTDDPRTTSAAFSSTNYYYFDDDDDDGASDEHSRVGTGDEDDYEGEEEDDDDDTADSSSLSSASPSQSSAEDPDGSGSGGDGPILVAAGCKTCFMYLMVPKRVDACPKCGCALLHLGRNGCF